MQGLCRDSMGIINPCEVGTRPSTPEAYASASGDCTSTAEDESRHALCKTLI